MKAHYDWTKKKHVFKLGELYILLNVLLFKYCSC